MLDEGFVPATPPAVEVLHLEAVEVADDHGVSSWVECGYCELLDLFVVSVVEVRDSAAVQLLEGHFLVGTTADHVLAHAQRVRDRGVHTNLLTLVAVQVQQMDGLVQVP